MTAAPLLGLGLALGLRHAFEADHVTAVAALATRAASSREVLRVAGAWGLGHALVLVSVGMVAAALGLRLPAWSERHLDGLVGVVLVLLGLDVLRRLRRVRGGGVPVRQASRRALIVGGVHGLAGSAALLVAVVPALGSPLHVLGYLALFGVGSIVGMCLCSLAMSVPLRLGARRSAGISSGLQLAVGASSVLLGLWLALRPLV